MAVLEGYKYVKDPDGIALTQLVAAGVTDTIKTLGFDEITAQYTIATINTTVVVRLEGSIDNSSWFNLDFDEQDTTQTANGTYALKYDGKVPFIRFRFVSETGGTAATIAVVIYLGGIL